MIINNPRDDRAFEADVDFNQQREYLGRFRQPHGFFIDWLIAIYWELQGRCSPFEYATRVCVAEKILETANLDHVLASQKVLLRVVRNLFPYDKISGEVPVGLKSILGESHGALRRPRFRPLQDVAVHNEELVRRRYNILGAAFCGQAQNLLKILREVVDEDEVPSYMNLITDFYKSSQQDLIELKRLRGDFYLSFPEEELTSVADTTIAKEAELKRRSELPKDMEPEYMNQLIGKLEMVVRSKLQTLVIEGKNAREGIWARRKLFLHELNELLTMCATVKNYVDSSAFNEVNASTEELIRHINRKFELAQYIPADLLHDIDEDHKMYKSGYL